jgi:hypothetical protein
MSQANAQAVVVTITASGIYVPIIPAAGKAVAQQVGLAQTGSGQTITLQPTP